MPMVPGGAYRSPASHTWLPHSEVRCTLGRAARMNRVLAEASPTASWRRRVAKDALKSCNRRLIRICWQRCDFGI